VKYHNFDFQGNYISKSTIPAKRQNVLDQIERQHKAQNTSFDRSYWEGVYITWLITDNLSFRQATSNRLRELLIIRDPYIEDVLPKDHCTISIWIKKYYLTSKQLIRSNLSKAISNITISFDGWTSASDMDLLGVMAHYIDNEYCHQTVLLALTPTNGSHTGENMAERLHHVINDYQIGSNIGYFIADGASNNDTAISLLGDDLPIDLHKQRLRCAAHIINLVCKAILLGVDNDCVEDACNNAGHKLSEEEDEVDETISRFEGSLRNEHAALKAWRKKGPVGKLHNLIVHIRGSPARRRYFESKQKEVEPLEPVYRVVYNGGVRWNSTHDMIDRALKLKDALELYQSAYRHDKEHSTSDDELTPDDWLELSQLHQLLHPMKVASTMIQANPASGDGGALWQNLAAIDYLMSHLEHEKRLLEFTNASHFKACVNLGWKKLNKYYALSDRTHAYCAAIFLNPRLRADWFIDKWSDIHPAWVKDVDTTMQQLYRAYQRRYPNERPKEAAAVKELSGFEASYTLKKSNTNTPEIERYKKEELLEGNGNIIHWWRDNRGRYPILARIALDLLAAPATTAADERVFSQADDVINDERTRLSEDTAEAIQCLRSWILANLVDLG
jgi:hypothetical protein